MTDPKTSVNTTRMNGSSDSGIDENQIDLLLRRAIASDESAIAELFELYRPRLKRMVSLRLDRRLQNRVDASDVIQEAFLDVQKQLPQYAEDPEIEFFLWLRLIAGQRLNQVHRFHLGTQMRDAGREVSIDRNAIPGATTCCLASKLCDNVTSVSNRMVREEMQSQLQDVLDQMDEGDREVLALKHFEELSNAEIGQVLGISESAASKRYIRSLRKLRSSAKHITGLFDR